MEVFKICEMDCQHGHNLAKQLLEHARTAYTGPTARRVSVTTRFNWEGELEVQVNWHEDELRPFSEKKA